MHFAYINNSLTSGDHTRQKNASEKLKCIFHKQKQQQQIETKFGVWAVATEKKCAFIIS